jgi:hypothetical protein
MRRADILDVDYCEFTEHCIAVYEQHRDPNNLDPDAEGAYQNWLYQQMRSRGVTVGILDHGQHPGMTHAGLTKRRSPRRIMRSISATRSAASAVSLPVSSPHASSVTGSPRSPV